MATERVIDLSESERQAAVDAAVAASLAALGVTRRPVSNDDRVHEAFIAAMREAGDFVTVSDIGRRLGLHQSSVSMICQRLVDAGRMDGPVINPNNGRNTYVPRVTE